MDSSLKVTTTDIVNKAREYLGTPFHHQGRLKGTGVDCIGLVSGVFKELNLVSYDNVTYSRFPSGNLLMSELRKVFDEVQYEEVREGDILVFWFNPRTKSPQHIGIKSSRGIIHTWAGVGKVVEHSINERWIKRILAVFRLKGVC